MGLPITIREGQDSDRNFMLNSWLLSYRTSNGFPRMPKSVYYGVYEPKFRQLLSMSTCWVACPENDSDAIVGYIVSDPRIHWVYVKYPYRKMGVAKLLLAKVNSDPIKFTLYTRAIEMLDKRYEWVYSPLV